MQVSLTPSENSFGLEVDFVEPQGDRTIISLRLQSGEIFLAEILGDFRPAIQQHVFVSFDQRHLNFFDAESGTNIFFKEKWEPIGD